MVPKGVQKAESRLRVAQKALKEMPDCKVYSDFVDTWYTFTVAAKSVWTMLEQAAKDNPQCRQWFGAKANERRNDELLQYLFEARNDDEHGLDQVTEQVPTILRAPQNRPGFSTGIKINKLVVSRNGVEQLDVEGGLDGKPLLLEYTPGYAKLASLSPRGRPHLDPPRMHMGSSIPDRSPIAVASLAMTYLSALVEEAKGRA